MDIVVVKEIRFAVVLYGGVSLAIYINGVAQELMRMVRATALKDDGAEFRVPDEELNSTELIYRDLAYLIGDKELIENTVLLDKYRDWLKQRKADKNPLTAELEERQAKGKNIKVARFVVDILSGTSAGGINGIFMAKALAAGQTLDKLEAFWLSEGDFSKLLNDEDVEETVRLGLKNQNPPLSLLNSQRMYLKLLRAFSEMDGKKQVNGEKEEDSGSPASLAAAIAVADQKNAAEPFVDEVDLFVTMTDFWGIPVPIRLFDRLIYERRHRQNLHFRFRKDDNLNDFDAKLYPFLAFSARATSSFPVAFDPMQIVKANQIIRRIKKQYKKKLIEEDLPYKRIERGLLQRSFKPTTVQDASGHKIKWNKRVFVDGGYLDNKPFGYAIAALAQKQSGVLVDRKLIYVEPKPEADDSRERATNTVVPPVLKNTLAAVYTMPGYETIREDLQEILRRNRLIMRVNQLVADARKDELDSLRLSFDTLDDIIRQHKTITGQLSKNRLDSSKSVAEQAIQWEELTLAEVAQQKGRSVYPYYRLRVAALTDNLARMVTHRAGYDEESDYSLAVRDLVHSWRRKKYGRGENGDVAHDENNQDAPTPMLFLREFDYDYRLRRLRFVLQQADRLLQFDEKLHRELEKSEAVARHLRKRFYPKRPFTTDEKRALQTRFSLIENEIYDGAPLMPSEIILRWRDAQPEELEQTVRSFKKEVNSILHELRRDLRQAQPDAVPDPRNPNNNKDLIDKLNNQVEAVAAKLPIEQLKILLGKPAPKDKSANGNNSSNKESPVDENALDGSNDLEARRNRAERFLAKRQDIQNDLDAIGETLKKIYSGSSDGGNTAVFDRPRKRIAELFDAGQFASAGQGDVPSRLKIQQPNEIYSAVRAYLKHFYDNFDAYDQIIFPITYETPIGEGAIIDVARISPLDATSLIDESKGKRRKLAGDVFQSFGAFFAEDWRKNDIVWGKLDAAERLVSIVLNNNLIAETDEKQTDLLRKKLSEVRQAVVMELHERILEESKLIQLPQLTQPASELYRRVNFVKGTDLIKRELDKPGVYETTVRSLTILRQILDKDEFSSFNRSKDIALDVTGLMFKPNLKVYELLQFFLKQFVPSFYLVIGFLILLSPLLIFAGGLLGLWFPSKWFLIGGLLLVILVYAALWVVYKKLDKSCQRLKSFLENTLYSKVTSVEQK